MISKKVLSLLVGTCLMLGMAMVVSAAAPAPARLQFTIPSVAKAPVIDGVLDDAAWVEVSIKGGKFVSDVSSTGSQLVDYPRIAYAGYNQDAMYVAYILFAPDVTKLETSQEKWWYNDEVEIIFDPNQQGVVTQYGIVVNGTTNSTAIQSAVKADGIKVVIEVAIPWSALNVSAPAKGDKWGMHFSGYQTNPKMWMSSSYASSFLRPEMMGIVVFGD